MKKHIRWLIPILIISFVGGIALDVRGFAVNLLASAIATVAGVWVTVVVIESILRQQRHEEWQAVRDRFYRALTQEIVSLAIEFNRLLTCTSYLSEILSMRDNAVANSRTLDKLLTSLQNIDSIPSKPQLDLLYKGCRWHLYRIGDIILPLVVSSGQELQLIEALQEFERAANQWELDQLSDVEPGVSTERNFKDSLETLASLRELCVSLRNTQHLSAP